MNRTSMISIALSLALPFAGMAQSATQNASVTASVSAQELHSLVKSANTAAQYKQLAGYFHQQETDYRAKAAAEKAEVDRRAQVNAALYQKYPRPVDTAESLYESYLSDANSAALQARHYEQLAAGQEPHDKQLADSQSR
jgi:hypothetical protein